MTSVAAAKQPHKKSIKKASKKSKKLAAKMSAQNAKNKSEQKASSKRKSKKTAKARKIQPKLTLAQVQPPQKMELELTLKNHFEFGYDGEPFVFRTSPEQLWWVKYGQCSRATLDWRTECLIAAQQIRASTEQDLWVCFSGGIDSQVVAEAFRYARVPFRAAILRFKNDLNVHDIAWAVIYCEMNGVPYEFFDLDVEDFFLGGELIELADMAQSVTPQLPSSFKLMELIAKKGGYPILGSAECYVAKHADGWVMYEREKIAAVYRYLIATKTPGQAGFFQWNPEIMYSFLMDRTVRRLVQNQIPNHQTSYYLKSEIYSKYWQISPRPKYTGFEKIMHLDRKVRPILEERYKNHNQECHINYAELISHLAPPRVTNV